MIYHVKCLTQVKKNQSCQISLVNIGGPLGPKMKLIKLLTISKAINMMMIVCLTISFVLPLKCGTNWVHFIVVVCYMVTPHTVCFYQHLYLSLKPFEVGVHCIYPPGGIDAQWSWNNSFILGRAVGANAEMYNWNVLRR